MNSNEDALQTLEGKLEATIAQRRPRRMWLDDIKQWTQLSTYEDIKRLAQDWCRWRACTVACQLSDLEDDSWRSRWWTKCMSELSKSGILWFPLGMSDSSLKSGRILPNARMLAALHFTFQINPKHNSLVILNISLLPVTLSPKLQSAVIHTLILPLSIH